MKKRSLSRLPAREATQEIRNLADRTEREKYIAVAERITVDEEKMLLLTFFDKLQLRKGCTGPALRTFISADDYITQDMETARVKWRVGRLQYILDFNWWNGNWNVVFADDESFRETQAFLGTDDVDLWKRLCDHQDRILKDRLVNRHEKECAAFDKKMEEVPEEPEWFRSWARETAVADEEVLLYQYSHRRETFGYCTKCRHYMKIDQKKMKLKDRIIAKCPECGAQTTMYAAGRFGECRRFRKWIGLTQKTPHGFVLRIYFTMLKFEKALPLRTTLKEEFDIYESFRIFYEERDGEPLVMSYEYGIYKQQGGMRWIPDTGRVVCDAAYICPDTVRDAIAGTPWQYCAVALLQRRLGLKAFQVWTYLNKYPRMPYLEYLVKMGLTRLALDAIRRWGLNVDEKAKKPEAFLKIKKESLRTVIELNPDYGELTLIRQMDVDGVRHRAEDIRSFYQRFGADDELLGVLDGKHIGIAKFARYADRQLEKDKSTMRYRNFSRDWRDHLALGIELGYDMSDQYYYLPPDFAAEHQRLIQEHDARKLELAKAQEEKVKALLEEMADTGDYSMESKKLMIRLPESPEEIREEGKILHHCVATYIDRVAKGDTMILFVRKKENPEKPYFTLEWNRNKVIQCRGMRNCDMPSDVKAFVRAFQKRMQKKAVAS